MNKKTITLLVWSGLLLVVLIGFVLFGYKNINSKFPVQKAEMYAMEEWVEYEKDIQIRVDKAEMLTSNELKKQREERIQIAGETDVRCVEITLTVKNDSSEEKTVDMIMYLQWLGGAQGADIMREGYSSGQETFSPGETRQLVYVFDLTDRFFKKTTWKNIDQLDFQLLYSVYPIERTVELDII